MNIDVYDIILINQDDYLVPSSKIVEWNGADSCEFPADNQLFIDIDGIADKSTFEERIGMLTKYCPSLEIEMIPSITSRHYHIKVTFPGWSFDVKERLFLQLFLGSDAQRELNGLFNHFLGDLSPTLLYKYPKNNPTKISLIEGS